MPANRGRAFERPPSPSSASAPRAVCRVPYHPRLRVFGVGRSGNPIPSRRSDRRRSLLAADHRTPSTSRLVRAHFTRVKTRLLDSVGIEYTLARMGRSEVRQSLGLRFAGLRVGEVGDGVLQNLHEVCVFHPFGKEQRRRVRLLQNVPEFDGLLRFPRVSALNSCCNCRKPSARSYSSSG